MVASDTGTMKALTEFVWDSRLPEAEKALVEQLNAAVGRLDGARAVEITKNDLFARSKLAWKLATYQHALLHRVIALVGGAALGWNNRNALVAMLSERALMETVAVLAELDGLVNHFLAREDIAGLDALAQNGLFASRDPEWLEAAPGTKAVNVLTYIDKFDKRAKGYRGHYDRLSERCHPNSAGHSQMFSKLDRSDGTVRYCDELDEERNAHMIFAALFPLRLVEAMSSRLDGLIQKVAVVHHRLHPVPTEVS